MQPTGISVLDFLGVSCILECAGTHRRAIGDQSIMRILIVEDDPTSSLVLATFLAPVGESHIAKDGEAISSKGKGSVSYFSSR